MFRIQLFLQQSYHRDSYELFDSRQFENHNRGVFGGSSSLIRVSPNSFDAIRVTVPGGNLWQFPTLTHTHQNYSSNRFWAWSLSTERLRSSLGRMLQTTIVNERDASGRNVETQVNERRILKVHDSQLATGMDSSRSDLHRLPQLL